MIGQVIQGINSLMLAQEEKKNRKKLESDLARLMQEEYKQYELDPTLQTSYNDMAQRMDEYRRAESFGLTPEQKSMAQQGVAQQQMINRQNAIRSGGGQMAGFMSAIDTNASMNAALKMASDDAALQLQKKQMTDAIMAQKANMAGVLQGQKNIITQGQQMRRQFLEQNLGAAIRDTRMRQYGALTSFGNAVSGAEREVQNAALSMASMGMGGQPGGGGNVSGGGTEGDFTQGVNPFAYKVGGGVGNKPFKY
jgi:hypothetical protein